MAEPPAQAHAGLSELDVFLIERGGRLLLLILVTGLIASACVAALWYRQIDVAMAKACRRGDASAVRWMLRLGARPDGSGRGEPPLATAAQWNSESVVRVLLEHGADPNAHRGSEQNPLMVAASHSSAQIVKMLLEHGADPTIRSWQSTALSLAGNRDLEIARILLARGDARAQNIDGALKTAAACDACAAQLEFFLAGDVSEAGKSAALAETGTAEQAEMLLAAGADVNGGDPPPLLSRAGSTPAVFPLLLAHGADPRVHDGRGRTALFTVAYPPHVVALVEAGADLEARDQDGETALLNALRQQQHLKAQTLIEHGADANAAQPNGRTALMLAAKACDHELVMLLLAHGADARATMEGGRTAARVARDAKRDGYASCKNWDEVIAAVTPPPG